MPGRAMSTKLALVFGGASLEQRAVENILYFDLTCTWNLNPIVSCQSSIRRINFLRRSSLSRGVSYLRRLFLSAYSLNCVYGYPAREAYVAGMSAKLVGLTDM